MMTDMVNTRELALNILLQIEKEKVPSHMAIRQMLEKYQFLPKQDRAFITRLCELQMKGCGFTGPTSHLYLVTPQAVHESLIP